MINGYTHYPLVFLFMFTRLRPAEMLILLLLLRLSNNPVSTIGESFKPSRFSHK
ncbi:hypothetical protein HMPREF0299_7060 [Corynebacterium matruchotii ATCC 14266]|uniref:Uncharacterized protein n=1 Tax=Corynebacterium matruchotii ATCC 14266 TaxID=553207 RepID=E0DGR0_9CORY|nr:hypothetical protein HMPREF0299_7060 [Corynebacterium matruchotii ATCC 14266]